MRDGQDCGVHGKLLSKRAVVADSTRMLACLYLPIGLPSGTLHERYANAAGALHSHIAEGRLAEAGCLVHSLKGPAATLAANDLAQAVQAVEYGLNSQEPHRLHTLLRTTEERLAFAIVAVSPLVPA
jgi:hypothetical protein